MAKLGTNGKKDRDQTETRPPKFKEKSMLTVSENTTANFELCPAGPTAARCSRLIDLGTHQSEFNGEKKWQRKLLITWELAELRTDGTPFQVSRRFGLSLHEKAALRAFLEAWRGKAFTVEELLGFDLRKLANAPCMLNLVHADRAGKQYANISAVMPLPKGMTAPDLTAAPVVFDIDDSDTHPALIDLSESLQATIEQSPEWKAHAGGEAKRETAGEASPDFVDDIPF
jgi:hypothetical protein